MTITQRAGTWAAATLLSVTGGLVPVASAQERPVSSTAQTAKPAGGMGEGIKVHGRWTIEVKNPDGSLVAVHRFENALVRQGQFSQVHVDTGDRALRRMLAGGSSTPPSWDIALANATDPNVRGWFRGGPCDGSFSEAAPGVCIARATMGLSPTGDLQLSAAVTAGPAAGQEGSRVGFVGTRVWIDVDLYIFSAHELSPLLTIAPGQIVQITVVFSFS